MANFFDAFRQEQFGDASGPGHGAVDFEADTIHAALIDTGTDDQFGDLLKTEALALAMTERRMEATIRMHKGYDHSYFFVSTFMEDHVAFHAAAMAG